jgi:hypothetical protein
LCKISRIPCNRPKSNKTISPVKTHFFLALSVLFIVLVPKKGTAAVLVTGFGTGQYNSTSTDFTTENQTATTYQLIGNDFGQSAFGDLQPSTVDVTGSTFALMLTATFSGTASSVFNIELFDTDGDSRLYKANFSSFTPSVLSNVNFSFFSETGTFNNIVQGIGFTTFGTGSSINITMDKLEATAAPEPTSSALMVVGLVSLVARRRRQVN